MLFLKPQEQEIDYSKLKGIENNEELMPMDYSIKTRGGSNGKIKLLLERRKDSTEENKANTQVKTVQVHNDKESLEGLNSENRGTDVLNKEKVDYMLCIYGLNIL